MVIAIPSLSNGQGVARTSREGDRDDQPVHPGRSITLRNGACPIPDPRAQHASPPGTYPPLPTRRWTPNGLAPTHPHWAICARDDIAGHYRVRGTRNL